MRFVDLFCGIGGFHAALHRLGHECVFATDIDKHAAETYELNWGKPGGFDVNCDIRSVLDEIPEMDIICAGFPCQPFSTAGRREGTSDNRYLWKEMLRVIHEVGPTYVVAENVRGLVSWSEGMVFDTVCADLEAAGYEVLPCLLPAAGVGAPHKRDRVWFVAYANHERGGHQRGHLLGKEEAQWLQEWDNGAQSVHADVPDEGSRLRGWDGTPDVPPFCGRDDGLSRELDGITFPKWRKLSLKAYGNAIVPHVALQIFKAIESLR